LNFDIFKPGLRVKSGFYIIFPMKLWISRNSEVTVRDQLATQITLIIASGEIGVGDKLPSTRETARRYSLHPNTVSSAYRTLVDQGLLEFKQGSGYFVCDLSDKPSLREQQIERAITKLFETGRTLGFEEAEIIHKVTARRESPSGNKLLLVESDRALSDILVHELSSQLDSEIQTVAFEDFSANQEIEGAVLVAMFDERPKIDPLLSSGRSCLYLKGNSVSSALSAESRPSATDMIAVVSGWDGFLTLAKIMLLAARIEEGNLIVRSTNDAGWKSAVHGADIVICDSLTASTMGKSNGARVFPIISRASVEELRRSMNSPNSFGQ
jgi:GntR family transcriptional regulator